MCTVDLLFFMMIPVTYALYPYFKQLVSFFPPLQIEVVNTFKSGTSFQGALRRQSSVTSQTQDVTNISSPSHVSLSNALSSPTSTSAAAAGRECEFLLHPTLRDANLATVAQSQLLCPSPASAPTLPPQTPHMITLCTVDTPRSCSLLLPLLTHSSLFHWEEILVLFEGSQSHWVYFILFILEL